jgi:hypothetical protein
MQKQLVLWPINKPPLAARSIWEELDKSQQAKLIASLARLISKAAELPNTDNTRQENNHE